MTMPTVPPNFVQKNVCVIVCACTCLCVYVCVCVVGLYVGLWVQIPLGVDSNEVNIERF